MAERTPHIVVLSTLFPSPVRPNAGSFIRERMFRVARRLPLTVVAPVPWFPLQGLIRLWRPHFRPPAPRFERIEGVEIYRPRFFSVPGLFKSWDGRLMALGCRGVLGELERKGVLDLIDAHFAFPDGDAATLLGRWFQVPVTITLRGTEVPHARDPARRRRLLGALDHAARVFSVSASLKRHVTELGADPDKIRVVGNGVDTAVFQPLPQVEARQRLGLPADARVLITVGGLVERKGFHRVLEVLPQLRREQPQLHYLIVGGASAEGDWNSRLRQMVSEQGLEGVVHFLGPLAPEALKVPLSAADVFVLASRNEGWANVLLEAMACGLPVVATDVGGNREVVCREALGEIVPFGDRAALAQSLRRALRREWDRDAIMVHARANAWDGRVEILVQEFRRICAGGQV